MDTRILFKTNKITGETEIVGKTEAEGKELDALKRSLATDGGIVLKDKETDFHSSTYNVWAADEETVKDILGEDSLGTTLNI